MALAVAVVFVHALALKGMALLESPATVSYAAAAALDPATPPPVHPPYDPALLDVNTATALELTTLPGIGPVTAAAIVNLREQLGGFRYHEELLYVKGIGSVKYQALLELITLSPIPDKNAPTDAGAEQMP